MACNGDTFAFNSNNNNNNNSDNNNNNNQGILPKGRSSPTNAGSKVAVLSKGRFSTAYSGTKFAVILGINRCGNFPLLPTLHSFLNICINHGCAGVAHCVTAR